MEYLQMERYRKNGYNLLKGQIDFTSALYLGMNHASFNLKPWENFTTGVPVVLKEPPASRQIAKAIARLQGMDEGLLYPSTLHLFWDLFESLGKQSISIFMDIQAYPISKWGIERVMGKGISAQTFSHNSIKSLINTMNSRLKGDRPIVVTDGWCPQCGKAAPLNQYLKILRPHNGLLVVDDTQGMGIFGQQPNRNMPLGYGGGGVPSWLGIKDKNIITGSSMAKGFGVPVAVLSGSSFWINKIRELSKIRIHCSPPSAAVLSATSNALFLNRKKGDQLRRQLLKRIEFFRMKLKRMRLKLRNGYFPIQAITNLNLKETLEIYDRLKKNSINPILTRSHKNDSIELTFLLTATQSWDDLRRLIKILAQAILFVRRTHSFSYP